MADTPLTVTRAVLQPRTPATTSVVDTGLAVTKADLQPSGSSVFYALNTAVDSYAFALAGSNVSLAWSTGALKIDVVAAVPALQLYNVVGKAEVTSNSGAVIFSGSDIAFAIAPVASPTLLVDSAAIGIVAEDAILEENVFFDNAGLSLSPKSINLTWAIVVDSAALSPTGQSITLSSTANLGVEKADISIAAQDIGLNWILDLAVTTTDLSILGQSIALDWQITDGTKVISAEPGITGLTASAIVMGQTIRTSEALPSFSGSTIGFKYDWGLAVDSIGPALLDPFGPVGQDIGMSFTYTLGLIPEPENIVFLGSNVVMFLGNGQPRRHRVKHKSPGIEIMLKPPITTSRQSKANVR